jgi:hypothetical protein
MLIAGPQVMEPYTEYWHPTGTYRREITLQAATGHGM